MKKILTPLADRFWAKVDKNGSIPVHCPELGPCWPWMGSRLKAGYGRIGLGRREDGQVLAHHVAYEQQVGSIPEGHRVLHHCDYPPCQRGSHLFTGTDATNVADKMAKGRGPTGDHHPWRIHPELVRRREHHPNAKLTYVQAEEIRLRYATGGISMKTLGLNYGVSASQIWGIVHSTSWVQMDTYGQKYS